MELISLGQAYTVVMDRDTLPHVLIWYVQGIDTWVFPTKIVAEHAARISFPNEDPHTRYGRIFYRKFYQEQT
jgi:hypothetical protein